MEEEKNSRKRNYDNIVNKELEEFLRVKMRDQAERKKTKKLALLNKLNKYKCKNSKYFSSLSLRYPRMIQRNENSSLSTFISFRNLTDKKNMSSFSKKRNDSFINQENKSKKTVGNSIPFYSHDESYNKMFMKILDKDIENYHLPKLSINSKNKENNAFFRRIKFTNSFKKIIKFIQ